MTDISTDAGIGTSSEFSIGDVFGRSFSIFGRHFIQFAMLSGIAMIPYLFFFWSQAHVAPGTPPKFTSASFVVPALVGGLLAIIARAAILTAAFQDMRDQPVNVGQSLRNGLARIFPIIGMSILLGLGVAAGSVLLIIPGIILLVMWSVALPACVVEQLGPIESLSRSAALTKGHRWKLFGIILIVGLVSGIGSAVIGAALALTHTPIVFTVGSYIWQTINIAFQSIAYVVMYRDLRVAKEGITTDQIASVFD